MLKGFGRRECVADATVIVNAAAAAAASIAASTSAFDEFTFNILTSRL